jgi:hypothetical protein
MLLLAAAGPACAAAPKALCAAAKGPLKSDPRLARAVASVFGSVRFASKDDEDCTYPLTRLAYRDADVLLTQVGVPGDACHGCEAHLSAHVLVHAGEGLKLAKSFPDFTADGSSGAIGNMTALTIGADDGMAIEGSGSFQGCMSAGLELFAFRAGSLVPLVAKPRIPLSASNEGAMIDEARVVSVTATWSLDPASRAAVVVRYKIEGRGRQRVETAVWTLDGARLLLTEGRVPPEMAEASGGG